MNLSQDEVKTFYHIWYTLIWGINEKHKILPSFKKPVYGEQVNEQLIFDIRNEMWEHPQWIDDFLRDGEFGELTEMEQGILKDWRNHFVKDRFIIMKHLKKHSVFMSFDEPAKLYAVLGISNPIKETMYFNPPCMVDAVLLPFKDKIIYDSFIATYNLSMGKGMKIMIKEVYDKTEAEAGIIEAMGVAPVTVKSSAKKPGIDAQSAKVPKAMSARYTEVAEIIEKFCDEKLNDEYKDICLRALAKLCRKRPSPISSGKANTWACGIVYAIGSHNLLFQKSKPIHMTATQLCDGFSLSKNTAAGKAAEIKDLLDLSYLNIEFSLRRHGY